MLILGIDTTTLVGSIGLAEEKRVLGEYTLNIQKTHSQRLLPALNRLLEDLGRTVQEVDLISVSQGPGSFTGVRIGVTTAKTLAQALEKPVVGVCSLDVLASNLTNVCGLICPILDARKQEVYTSLYQADGRGNLRQVLDYSALGLEQLLAIIGEWGQGVYFLGDAVPVYAEKLQSILQERYLPVPPNLLLPRGSSVAWLGLKEWKKGSQTNFEELQPFYLRRSEAELAWEKKQGGQNGKCSD